MGKSRKSRKSSRKSLRKSLRKSSRNHKNNKQIGGINVTGLPNANWVSLFGISNDLIQNFRRPVSVPMDCFINALQFIGILDPMCANIMRVSTLGDSGFTRAQIEIIFSFFYKTNFHFKSTDDFEVWYNWIVSNIRPGHVVFAGYPGHVFLIASDGERLVYIDPQINGTLHDFSSHEGQQLLRGKGTYYLLFNSEVNLTQAQQDGVLNYAQRLSEQAYAQRNQQPVQQPNTEHMIEDTDDNFDNEL